MFVKNKMVANPFTVSPEQTIIEAQEIMVQNGVKRLPVMKDGKLVGVVSKDDIIRYSPTKATSLSVGEITYLLAKTKIKDIMSKELVTISPDALLEEAVVLMRHHDVSFLPVLDNGRLVGIVTASDIFDAFIELSGFKAPGTRLTIESIDEPGMLSKLSSAISKFGANITHIAVYGRAGGKSAIVMGINTLNTKEIEETIEKEGFEILYKLQNK
ncbi:MAG: CBS and ACT domain-containing protein [Eubacteriales bacterium]|jgi:acetoin utilization protein AcuB|nr:CBS and ACT domain-containing protein [Eubacteriales bacterium]